MPLLTPNHSYKTCGGPEAFTSTTILKKCGAKTSSERQECYILKTCYGSTYQSMKNPIKDHNCNDGCHIAVH